MECYTGYAFIAMLFTYLFFSAYLNYETKKLKIKSDIQVEKIRTEVLKKQNQLLNDINKKLERK